MPVSDPLPNYVCLILSLETGWSDLPWKVGNVGTISRVDAPAATKSRYWGVVLESSRSTSRILHIGHSR
jgi:hypothetical protein